MKAIIIVLMFFIATTGFFELLAASENEKQETTANSATVPKQDSTSLKALEDELIKVQKELESVKVAKDYFSSMLNSLAIIFSTMVLVLVGITWVFTYLRVRAIARHEVSKAHQEIVEVISEWRKTVEEKLVAVIETRMKESQALIQKIEADTFRGFAQIHEEDPEVAYIWWLRAAEKYPVSRFIRVSLEGAQAALKKIQYRHSIELDMEEIEQLLSSIDPREYKLQLDLIRAEIERIYKTTVS